MRTVYKSWSNWGKHLEEGGLEVPNKMSDYYATTALLPDGRLERVKLEDYQGSFVLLLFYPGDFTDLAKGEILAFAESFDRFTANQCQVILHAK